MNVRNPHHSPTKTMVYAKVGQTTISHPTLCSSIWDGGLVFSHRALSGALNQNSKGVEHATITHLLGQRKTMARPYKHSEK